MELKTYEKRAEPWRQSKSGLWYNYGVCQGMVAHIPSVCEECGAGFFERKYKAGKSGSGRHFCSRSCSSKATVREQDISHLAKYNFKKGQVPHNFIGETSHSAGYRVVSGNGKKRQLKHRAIMEQHLGRKLSRAEIVHHINGNKVDNQIENLVIMSQSEHCLAHRPHEYRKEGGI